jgi:C-terminal peptidase prc
MGNLLLKHAYKVLLVAFAIALPYPAQAATTSAADVAQQSPLSEEDDSGETDYWKEITFTKDDFAEVRSVVKLFYIDPGFDKRMAWISASDFILRTMDPPLRLLPDEFFLKRQGTEYKGVEPVKLSKKDPFVIVNKPEAEPLDFRALSDDDIRKKKETLRAKSIEREKAWSKIAFTEKDFDRIFDWVRARNLENSAKIDSTDGTKKPEITESTLYIAAAQGYLASLDPHTTIISAKAWADATKDTVDGSFEGIGAMLTTSQEAIIIETPIEGQPAERAGLKAGDQIMAVDGRVVTGMPLHKVVKLIKGEKGSTVVMKIRRQGMPDDVEFRIVRQHIEVRNVQAKTLKNHPDMGYLKVTGFVDGTSRDVDNAIRDLIAGTKGGRLRGLVLDLRMNSGGLLQESVEIADAFLDDGVIVSVKSPAERDETYNAKEGKWDFPVVVLVNSGSASASEILASALQENGRAVVLGDRTFGKASVQTLMPPYLRKDYFIKITVARYYSPSGRTIQVTGVMPDVDVPPEIDGKQPIGFREEDLAHHLTKIKADYKSPNANLISDLKKCSDTTGVAVAAGRANPHPTIKTDFQLMAAGDYLECLFNDRDRQSEVSRNMGKSAE